MTTSPTLCCSPSIAASKLTLTQSATDPRSPPQQLAICALQFHSQSTHHSQLDIAKEYAL
ncbi:hypothetical protein CIPAW_07G121300 [Carya illinoinensis]|uniref:Uncharacterized protein n=1 Tax=Carya illinoinensis TaxID=32201 RepID=A0A8T1Q281_CARIL|nr:hypothetical protein CIPAW_07G121300 [Carya illinoinensis]